LVEGSRGRAVVIGGGLAGLAAGYRLSCNGWDVLVLEKEPGVGGRCRTSEAGGFQFDTGVQHFRDSYDTTLKTAIETGVSEGLRIPGGEKGIVRDGKISHFVPRSPNPFKLLPWRSAGPAGLVDLSSVAFQLLRRYRSYNVRFPDWWEHGDLETAEDFLSKKTTPRFRSTFAGPVSLYACGAELGALSASGFMVALRCTFADRTGVLNGGMGTLPGAMARHLDVKTDMSASEVVVERGAAVAVKARPTAGGRSRSYRADLVVCAVPAPLVKEVTGDLGEVAGRVIEEVSYSPAMVVNLGFTGIVGGGPGPVLLPAAERFQASWICTHESKAFEYVPDGGSLVTLVYAGDRCSSLIGEEDWVLAERALEEASRVLDLKGMLPARSRVDRHGLGRPVVSPGHARRVQELEDAGSGIDNLALAGDWTSSPTLEGAMTSGFRAAERFGLRP